jgi:hypothetical protein
MFIIFGRQSIFEIAKGQRAMFEVMLARVLQFRALHFEAEESFRDIA